ncbi:MAG: iron chelate uptake ABC transporter family permease subunit [Eubacteriaceae bacterium]|jgi:iron complex transport system permease protein|nr:iron chelate uptake ABC transporter family permease subunit [Eubacteriaceae bacterium]
MKKRTLFFAAGLLFSCALIVVLTFFGAASITLAETSKILAYKIFGFFSTEMEPAKVTIIWKVRFPRALLAFLCGGSLALCGGAYQALFKNPMADPFVLGVSSGAAFGATMGIVFQVPVSLMGLNVTSWFAFAGSLTAIFFVYNIAKIGRQTALTSLLLTGTALSQFLTAIISIFMMLSGENMQRIYFWTLGSFNARGWSHILVVAPYIAIGGAVVLAHCRELDIIMLGDDTAVRMGVESEKIKRNMLVTTAFVMSACVSVSGIIGFVGLVAPHVVRLFTGPKHAMLLPASFLAGGSILALCDTIARSATRAEIPVGIVTAILGAPFFIYLLRTRRAEVL